MNTEIEELGKVSVTVDPNDWNKGKPYETLTIVTDPNLFRSAISLRDVPPGIDFTDKRFWLIFASLDQKIVLDYITFKNKIEQEFEEYKASLNDKYKSLINSYTSLKSQMETFLSSESGGTALADELGNSEYAGITQKGITKAINDLWDKIADMEGSLEVGFDITITPKIVLAYDEADVTVNVSARDKQFDYIKVYLDGNLVIDQQNVETVSYTTQVTEDTEVKVVASVLGIEYERTKIINVEYPFFIGCGTNWNDIINTDYLRPYNGTLQGHYTINAKYNDKIFIVIPTAIDDTVEHIQMGGFDIPFTKTTSGEYTIYTSSNNYDAGEYLIDINF